VLQTLQRPATQVDRGLREELVAVAVQQVQMMAVVDEITSRRENIAHTSYADHMKYAV
jgi:hypothetical protein